MKEKKKSYNRHFLEDKNVKLGNIKKMKYSASKSYFGGNTGRLVAPVSNEDVYVVETLTLFFFS